ncbi:hypothetical protein KSP39_PZI014283 [Platanthera zijinensis]|uniref:Uncharacterized protein n=1 Tax=Platanthera zijinensis TaxID=2320716 RepID=A0AAP0G2B8_9ASPA
MSPATVPPAGGSPHLPEGGSGGGRLGKWSGGREIGPQDAPGWDDLGRRLEGIVEPSMEEQPRRSARFEIGQSSLGVQTEGTNWRFVVMTLQGMKVSLQSGDSGPKTPVF